MLGILWFYINVKSPGGHEWLIMSHCFLNGSTSKSTVGNETKDNIISILCCFESKLLAFTVWKEKEVHSVRVQFSELLPTYIPFCYISSFFYILVLIIQADKVTEKNNWVFPFIKEVTLNLNWILSNLATYGHFPLVTWLWIF